MNITRFTFCILLAALVWGTGCATPKPTPDPLIGWKSVSEMTYKVGEMSASVDELPNYKAISDDVQEFVNKLPVYTSPNFGPGMAIVKRRYCYWMDHMTFFEDGTGQHAVKIEIPVEGTYQNYVLIYNKDDVRIKTINFSSGHYAC